MRESTFVFKLCKGNQSYHVKCSGGEVAFVFTTTSTDIWTTEHWYRSLVQEPTGSSTASYTDGVALTLSPFASLSIVVRDKEINDVGSIASVFRLVLR